MNEYDFIRLNSENFSDLLDLMTVINGVAPDPIQLQRKYETQAIGAPHIGFLAYAKGEKKAAAFYGVFPVRLYLDHAEVLAAQSGDTMTHPNHRGKGLFIALAQKTYTVAAQEGIQLVFGFPNRNSYPGFVKKLGWQHPYTMAAIDIWTPSVPFNFLSKKIPSLEKFQRKWLMFLLSKFFNPVVNPPESCSSVIGNRDFGVLRNQAYWDYKQGINAAYQISGATILLKYDGDLVIGDVLAPNEAIPSLIRRLQVVAALAGIVRIKTYCSPKSALAQILSRKGRVRESLAYGYVAFNASLHPERLQFTYFDYDTF